MNVDVEIGSASLGEAAGRRLCGYEDEWRRASAPARAAWTRAAQDIDLLERASAMAAHAMPAELAGPVEQWLLQEASNYRRQMRIVCSAPIERGQFYFGPPTTPLSSVQLALDMAGAIVRREA